MDKTEFTRRDLYELVWSVPMREAAKTLETNAWYLPYLCKRHQVPRPETGYWTKRRLGHPYTKPDLPPGEPEDTIVHTCCPKEPDILDVAFLTRADALLAREMDPSMTVEVVRELENPHRLVAEARQELDMAQPDYTGSVACDGPFSVRVTSGQIGRALLLLETLARACEKRGYLVPPKRDSRCIILGEKIGLQVKEKLSQKSNPHYRENTWGHPEGYKCLHEPTGILILKAGNLKMTDGPSGPLESRMQEAMTLLVKAAVDLRREALEKEERERRWEIQRREEAERARTLAEKRRQLKELKDAETRRVERLDHEMDGWIRSRQIREYVDTVRAFVIGRDGDITEGGKADLWIKWALEQADRADPLSPTPYSILDEPDPTM